MSENVKDRNQTMKDLIIALLEDQENVEITVIKNDNKEKTA